MATGSKSEGERGVLMGMIEAIRRAEHNVEHLAEPQQLRSAADQVAKFAVLHGATALLAASPSAERLLGAALVSSSELTGFSLEDPQPLRGRVLLLDVNLASGTALARASRRARLAGAGQVIAVVMHQLTDDPATASDCGVDALTVLEPR